MYLAKDKEPQLLLNWSSSLNKNKVTNSLFVLLFLHCSWVRKHNVETKRDIHTIKSNFIYIAQYYKSQPCLMGASYGILRP